MSCSVDSLYQAHKKATIKLFYAWPFQMFLCVVVFGLFHGILLLPVLLSLIGSHSEHDEEPFDDEKVFQSHLILFHSDLKKDQFYFNLIS